jgi:acyl-coenzyme A thioesterase PaaI-like protein
MKVIYAKPISEQIIEAQAEATRAGRRIEKIVLTQDEFNQLKAEARRVWEVSRKTIQTPSVTMFAGVRLEIEKEEF